MLSKTLFILASMLLLVVGGAESVELIKQSKPWLWAVFGVILYNYLSFNLHKDELDDSGKQFSFKTYRKGRWDNWVWSILCVPVIVVYGDQLWYYTMAYFEKDWKFYDVIYLGAGVLAEGLYYILKKFKLVINALRGKTRPIDG